MRPRLAEDLCGGEGSERAVDDWGDKGINWGSTGSGLTGTESSREEDDEDENDDLRASCSQSSRSRCRAAASCALSLSMSSSSAGWGDKLGDVLLFWVMARSRAFSSSSSATRLDVRKKR